MPLATTYLASPDRYRDMIYRRCGRSGVDLPAISLGLWHNFGGVDILRMAAPWCAGPSTSASPISTWPTTMARRSAPRSKTSAECCRLDLSPIATS